MLYIQKYVLKGSTRNMTFLNPFTGFRKIINKIRKN